MDQNQTIRDSQKLALTLTIPNPLSFVLGIKSKIFELLSVVYNPLRSQAMESGDQFSSRVRGMKIPKFRFSKKSSIKIIFPLIIGIIVIAGIVTFVRSIPDAQSTPTISNIKQPDSIASQTIEKSKSFPIRDGKGKEIGSFEYTVKSAEIRKQIIVQGRSAGAIQGRVFLIFNLKVNNSIDKSLQINTRDYVRVIVASNKNEKLAADIHNDPVEVQAISTKYTRIGLAINEEDSKKPIVVQIGEIGGEKEIVELNFK